MTSAGDMHFYNVLGAIFLILLLLYCYIMKHATPWSIFEGFNSLSLFFFFGLSHLLTLVVIL